MTATSSFCIHLNKHEECSNPVCSGGKMTATKEIKDYLEGMAKLRGNLYGQERLVLDYGKSFHVTPKTLEGKRATQKECYKNSFYISQVHNNLTKDCNLTYVEGYVH